MINYEETLQTGLKDKSAYVRKSAVLGIVKVFHMDPGVVDSKSHVCRKEVRIIHSRRFVVKLFNVHRDQLC